jgi:hypothetical protein
MSVPPFAWQLIEPGETVRKGGKLFDRFKHYYTSISCWAGASRWLERQIHRPTVPASPSRLPPAPPAAHPPKFLTSFSPRLDAAGRYMSRACASR